ncbi:hypothetical protein CK203_082975 [Vitis vinifera]|uniref:Uncharacterized protein n=1 Tax=Vitis vinifera TaxID=29760 RepID=A0A438DEL4_VITVI|nr:hypothetical protein CK203_082975 [Vitis vinifera]
MESFLLDILAFVVSSFQIKSAYLLHFSFHYFEEGEFEEKKCWGLGIRSLSILNKALLGKWVGEICENDFEASNFREVWGGRGGWCSTGVKTRWYGVRVWKAIKSGGMASKENDL